LLYLVLRIGLTTGYEHQIDPAGIIGRVTALTFPAHFFVQLILAQGILVLLLVLIAMKTTRYAVYLAASAGVMALVAVATWPGTRLTDATCRQAGARDRHDPP
jgi:hypothetical protein